MRLRVGQAQRDAPGHPYYHPPVDAEVLAQPFDVVDEVRRGVGREIGGGLARQRPAAPTPALVEEDRPERGRVEEPAHARSAAGPGPAVETDGRHAVGAADRLPVQAMAVGHLQ